jgi:hypothetical protein
VSDGRKSEDRRVRCARSRKKVCGGTPASRLGGCFPSRVEGPL